MKLWIVNAFSSLPGGGNPAAVCLLDRPAGEDWMQSLAARVNLSETAFLLRQGKHYSLRWFTPSCEVDLCGHATLASAYYLWHFAQEKGAEISFNTRSGLLTAARESGLIWLDFPADPPAPVSVTDSMQAACGQPVLEAAEGKFDLLLRVESERAVEAARMNLEQIKEWKYRGVILTAPAERAGCDFVSRFFAPAAGIPEDPVTGSAHCLLGPFWKEKLKKDRLTAYQASRRGGTVYVHNEGKRLKLGGEACLGDILDFPENLQC